MWTEWFITVLPLSCHIKMIIIGTNCWKTCFSFETYFFLCMEKECWNIYFFNVNALWKHFPQNIHTGKLISSVSTRTRRWRKVADIWLANQRRDCPAGGTVGPILEHDGTRFSGSILDGSAPWTSTAGAAEGDRGGKAAIVFGCSEYMWSPAPTLLYTERESYSLCLHSLLHPSRLHAYLCWGWGGAYWPCFQFSHLELNTSVALFTPPSSLLLSLDNWISGEWTRLKISLQQPLSWHAAT